MSAADGPAASASHSQPTAANDAYADPASTVIADGGADPLAAKLLDGRFARIGNAATNAARVRRGLTAASAAVLAVALVVIGYPVYVAPTRVDIDTSTLPRTADIALPMTPPTLGPPPAPGSAQILSTQTVVPAPTARPTQAPAQPAAAKPAPAPKAAAALKSATARPAAAPRSGEFSGDAAAAAATLGLVSPVRIEPQRGSGGGTRSVTGIVTGSDSRSNDGIAGQRQAGATLLPDAAPPPEGTPARAATPVTAPPATPAPCSPSAAALGLCGFASPAPKE